MRHGTRLDPRPARARGAGAWRLLSPWACLALALLGLGCGGAFKRFAYEGFDRDSWQHPERVIESLAIEPGMRVADIGAGGGYFTFRLADAVGPQGRVFAVDVDDDMITYLRDEAMERSASQVEVVRGEFGDPRLPDGEVDLVFTSNTFHHLEDPVAYFRLVRRDLAPGGRVAILDLDEGPFFAREHFTEPERIVADMEEAGYRLLESFDFIDGQSFQVFAPGTDPPG